MSRLLYVSSRWPWPVDAGRNRMIEDALAMAARTHSVFLTAIVSRSDPRRADAAARFPSARGIFSIAQGPSPVAGAVLIDRPGSLEAVGDALLHPATPMQAHLFCSRRIRREIAAVATAVKPAVVMLDMIRLWPLADAVAAAVPGARIVCDMDDLLSERYAQMADGLSGDLFGAFADSMPRWLRAAAGALPRTALRLESALARRAEETAAARADAVTLVSPLEARRLASRCPGAAERIIDVPPSVDDLPVSPRDFSGGVRFVFLGNEHYAPNVEALAEFDAAAALLRGEPGVAFETAGRRDDRIVTPHLRRLGFVSDLDAFLGPDAVMVAPVKAGTGIKTKILEGMARGLPVIGYRKAFEGIDVGDEGRILVDDPAGLAEAMRSCAAPGAAGPLSEIGRSAARKIAAVHNRPRVRSRFAQAIGQEAVLELA